MSAELPDLLRRAAERLRDPYRCNTDWITDQTLADWLDHAARDFNGDEAHTAHAVAVARSVLRDRADDDNHPTVVAARATRRSGGTTLGQGADHAGTP